MLTHKRDTIISRMGLIGVGAILLVGSPAWGSPTGNGVGVGEPRWLAEAPPDGRDSSSSQRVPEGSKDEANPKPPVEAPIPPEDFEPCEPEDPPLPGGTELLRGEGGVYTARDPAWLRGQDANLRLASLGNGSWLSALARFAFPVRLELDGSVDFSTDPERLESPPAPLGYVQGTRSGTCPPCDTNHQHCGFDPEPDPPTNCDDNFDECCGCGDTASCDANLQPPDPPFPTGSTSNVYPHNGQFTYTATDLAIPGRGLDFRFKRTYKSQISYDSPIGFNWDHNYNTRLVRDLSGDIFHMEGNARANRYVNDGGSFTSPAGFFTGLHDNGDDTFSIFHRDGTRYTYAGFTHTATDGALSSITDRNGNSIRFFYEVSTGRLVSVRDTLDREIVFRYDENGRIEEIEDFFGRIVQYGYDTNGDLTSVTSPSVTGTPNGNDFPLGKTSEYTYLSGFSGAQEALNHNLDTIKRPNEVDSAGPAVLDIDYGTDDEDPLSFDRVTSQLYGGLGAGGTLTYDYVQLDPCTDPDDLTTACVKTTITDRVGNVTDYEYNRNQNLLATREFTRGLRPTDPVSFDTTATYNADTIGTQNVSPEGDIVDATYDDSNPDRLQQNNVLEQRITPDPARGGDQAELVTVYTYEPIYNQVKTVCDPRGSDGSFVPPVDPGSTGCSRYTTEHTFDYEEGCDTAALAAKTGRSETDIQNVLSAAGVCAAPLGDVNADGVTDQISGNIIRTEHPTVHLVAGSNQAIVEGDTLQEIVELFVYNDFGQQTKYVDPEGNVDEYFYYPENDPDGDGQDINTNPELSTTTGGYLRETIRDSGGTDIGRQYSYDRVGNVTREVDGRGIATDYFVNELNQVVQETRAAAHDIFTPDPPEPLTLVDFAYITQTFFDFNDNVVERRVEDRGNTSNTGGFVSTVFAYNILDDLTLQSEEVSTGTTLVTTFEYDANQNRTRMTEPEGNFHTNAHDERDLLFTETRGAGGPFGGTASTTSYHYDQNRNLVEIVDAADTDSSPGNGSPSGGAGDRTRLLYDGFDRLTSRIDAVGNQTVHQYDPVGNVVRTARFGPVGGASPTSDGGPAGVPVSSAGTIQTGNLVTDNLLEATEHQFDELNRHIEVGAALFVNTTATVRTPDVADGATDIGKGDLTPGDTCAVPGVADPPGGYLGCVSTRTEFDRNSRPTFVVQDDLDVYAFQYDGADRLILKQGPEGNVSEVAYDDNDNVIETRETDKSQAAGVADEIFLSTYFYDSLNRHEKSVDNLGQTVDQRHDSRDNLVALADASGPAGPTISRRAFPSGPTTVNVTNGFGNVVRYSYDGLNRLLQTEQVLTASGQGDGTSIGATAEGVKTSPPTPDPSQSGDGFIRNDNVWDDNGRLKQRIDDNGNRTDFTYDNLDRILTETKGTCVAPMLADRCDPTTTITYVYDPDDNVASRTDENGSATTCAYDALNRTISCSVTRGAGVVGTTALTYEYDGLDRATSATDDNEPVPTADDSEVTRSYDSLSRPIEERQAIGALSIKVTSSAWRAERLRSSVTYPNGRALDSFYDDLDRLNQVEDSGAGTAIATYEYIGTERIAERLYPGNGVRLTFLDDPGTSDVGYDGLRRPIQARHLRSDDSLVVGVGHTYDRADNRRIQEKLHALTDSELYTYDSAYRLLSYERGTLNAMKDAISVPSPRAPIHASWTLDGAGNWPQVDSETRKHTSFNEIFERNPGAPITLLSDDNGNTTDDATLTFQWDYRNRLRTVTRKGDAMLVATYSYDASGRRVRRVVTNSGALDGTTEYYYDGVHVAEERDSSTSDVLVQQYVYGTYFDEVLVLDRNLNGDGTAIGAGDQRLFYHGDAVQSLHALTDAAAVRLEGYIYDAFGRQTVYAGGTNGVVDFGGDDVITPGGSSSLASPYLFTGRRLDPETSQYYYRSRYLDPVLGRFTSRDGMGVWADILNRGNGYAYVGNNPLRFRDPLGLLTAEECERLRREHAMYLDMARAARDRIGQLYSILAGEHMLQAWATFLRDSGGAILDVVGYAGWANIARQALRAWPTILRQLTDLKGVLRQAKSASGEGRRFYLGTARGIARNLVRTIQGIKRDAPELVRPVLDELAKWVELACEKFEASLERSTVEDEIRALIDATDVEFRAWLALRTALGQRITEECSENDDGDSCH